jgi:uncharacterized protein YceH (UPF0502 family)
MAYDPAARRERYLRNRQLKGRRSGRQDEPVGSRGPSSTTSTADRHRREAEARLAALKQRLTELRTKLEDKLAEAKARSGVETKKDNTPSTSSKASSKTGGGSSKPTTAKEKREASERWEKHKKENPDKSTPKEPSVQAEIEQIRQQIEDIRAKLKAAVEKARQSSTQAKTETAAEGR